MCEPDSREPWFVSASHDESCLARTLAVFEAGVDATSKELEHAAGSTRAGEKERSWPTPTMRS
jgi:glutamate-1-semialdehyde 2,1-aminomutase